MVRWISALSTLQLFKVTTAHTEGYSTRLTSWLALGCKQSEHGNILCEMLRQSKELENITYRDCKNLGVVPSTVYCQVEFSCLFKSKIPSCKYCLKKRLGKSACRVCGEWWTYYQTKTVGFHNSKITQQSKKERMKWKWREHQDTQSPWWKTCQWGRSVESLQNNLQIFKPSSEICSLSLSTWGMEHKWITGVFESMLLFKECVFQCYLGFSTGARISWARCLEKVWGVWHRHSWFCRHSNAFVILGHQEIHYKYDSNNIDTKIETEPRVWKVGKQVFESVQRECSWLVQC